MKKEPVLFIPTDDGMYEFFDEDSKTMKKVDAKYVQSKVFNQPLVFHLPNGDKLELTKYNEGEIVVNPNGLLAAGNSIPTKMLRK